MPVATTLTVRVICTSIWTPRPGPLSLSFEKQRWLLRDELDSIKIKSYPKTTGSRGIHIYIPIVRGPLQKEVWTFAKAFSVSAAQKYPKILTSEYRVAKRSPNRILVDYNQNAWGRTLASVYSVRPKPRAPVSAPVTWEEVERGIEIAEFPHRQHDAAPREGGRPLSLLCSSRKIASSLRLPYEIADQPPFLPMEAKSVCAIPIGADGNTNPSGMASAASPFAMGHRGIAVQGRTIAH